MGLIGDSKIVLFEQYSSTSAEAGVVWKKGCDQPFDTNTAPAGPPSSGLRNLAKPHHLTAGHFKELTDDDDGDAF